MINGVTPYDVEGRPNVTRAIGAFVRLDALSDAICLKLRQKRRYTPRVVIQKIIN